MSATASNSLAPATATIPWQPGTVVGGRYRLERLLGRGAMAEVWRAEHVTLGTAVAVKLVAPTASGGQEQTLERFVQEARAAARLQSPFVVQIYDHGSEGDRGYIAMEMLEGESLRDRLTRLGRLAPLEVARVLSQLAAGVEVAHGAGIVHRDLKPENVFLATVHGQEVVKILDFGIARQIDIGSLDRLASHEGLIVGTPCYMSPEQITGARVVDARSDLWQLGVIAFECLCGCRPFDAPAAGELMVNICSKPPAVPSSVVPVPLGFDEWFAQAVEPDPDDRFASASELAESLCHVLAPDTTASALAGGVTGGVPMALQSGSGLLDSTANTRSGARRRPGSAKRKAARHRSAVLGAAALALVVAVAGIVVGSWVLSATDPDRQDPSANASGTRASAPPPQPSGASTLIHTGTSPAVDGGAAGAAGGQPNAASPSQRPANGQPLPTRRPAGTGRAKPRPEDVLGI